MCRAHYIILPKADGALREVEEPRHGGVLEAHMEPVGHDFVVAPHSLNCHGVELQELERVVPAVVAGRKVWLELDRLDDVAQVEGEGVAGT